MMTTSSESPGPHPGSETVAAFLDGALSPDRAAAVEAHLADCPACRLESAEVLAVMRARRRRRTLLWLAPLASAAGILLVLSVPSAPSLEGRLRSDSFPGGPAGGTIEVIAPVGDLAVPVSGLAFRWRAAAAGPATYALTLTDVAGNLVWSTETGDTVALLPDSVRLSRGRDYLWYVDARLPGARSASSGVRELRTSP